jgi:hypothetical protein
MRCPVLVIDEHRARSIADRQPEPPIGVRFSALNQYPKSEAMNVIVLAFA